MVPGCVPALHRCQGSNGAEVIVSLHTSSFQNNKMKHMEALVDFRTESALQYKISIPDRFLCTEFLL